MNLIFAVFVAVIILTPDKPIKLTGPIVRDQPNKNRRQNSGPIFYVNKQKKGPFKVILTCKTAKRGQLTDGKAPNLILRVFDPNDKSIAVTAIKGKNQEVKTVVVDLSNDPVGRYRLSVVGWFSDMAIKTEPKIDGIGIAGGYTLGLHTGKSYYLYLTGSSVNIKASTLAWPRTKHTIQIKDHTSGKTLFDKEIVNSRSSFTEIKLDNLKAGSLLSLKFTGKKPCKLIINGTVPILWTSAKAALRSKGDQIKVGKRIVAHAWQKTLAEWLQNRKKEDFELADLKVPKFDSSEPKYNKYALNIGWNGALIPVAKNLMQHNQITDPANKNVGLFKDAKTKQYKYGQIGYALTVLALYSLEMEGLNPYYKNDKVKNRALAALFQCMLLIPENQLMTFDFVLIKFLGTAVELIGNDIKDDKLKDAFRDGVLEFMSRNSYFDGYQSNQGLNVIVGLHKSLKFTKDKTMADWYDRYMNAFFNDQFIDVNHGQTPEGFYQESGGLDGGYNSYSSNLILGFWQDTQDDKYLNSLKKNFNLLRYISVTHPLGGYTSACQWNTRTARPAWGNHNQRAGYAIPECVTFILRGQKANANLNKARKYLSQKLNAVYKKNNLENRKFWGGYGALAMERLSPEYVQPEKLFCEIKGDFIKKIGKRYLVSKQGDFYAVFFSGDRWHVGDAGSGLATLWHKDFGSLILGDTLMYKKNKKQILSFCETWTDAKGQEVSSFRSSGDIKQIGNDIIMQLKLRKRNRKDRQNELIRTYTVSGTGLSSFAINNDKVWKNHVMYLPLVSNKHIKLEIITNKHEAVSIPENGIVKASAFRWTNPKGEQLELKLNSAYDVSLHTRIKYRRNFLNVIKINVGNSQGQLTIRRIKL